jgi:hypothetical protein
MSKTLTQPRSIVAILAVSALAAIGVLLLLGVFDDDSGPRSTALPSSGAIEQVHAQQRERRLMSGGGAGKVHVTDANTKAYEGYAGTGAPTADPVAHGDTKNDVHNRQDLSGSSGIGGGCGSSLANRCSDPAGYQAGGAAGGGG